MDNEDRFIWRLIKWGVLTVVLLIAAGMYGCPQYNVWEQGLRGEAALKRAQQERQIAVATAEAKRDAAVSLAEAEITRASGVAKANKIIGDSLRDNEAYLRYLWIDNIAERKGDTIYIPTEAGLPILEAARLRAK